MFSMRFVHVFFSDTPKGCLFPETVFMTKDAEVIKISAVATTKGICDIIFVTDLLNTGGLYVITYLWTTSVNQNVKVFIGFDKSRLYFEFKFVFFKSQIYRLIK